jgi:electron transfer flavoprotein alpha subunit
MARQNPKGEVWVFAEQEDGQLHEVALELLSKGRELADRLGVPLASCLLGYNVDGLAEQLVRYGADKVYAADHKLLARYQTNPYARTLVQMVEARSPQVLVLGASPLGRDLAPRVASALRAGLTADCTELEIGEHTEPSTKKSYQNLLLQIRPAFGGNIIATIVNPEWWPQMATVREGVMVMPEADPGRTGEIVPFAPELDASDLALEILETTRAEKTVDLKKARVIVAGGAGVGSKENFRLLWDLANVLGAAVGASRAAVDNGWIGKDHQVGQTGTTVRPALYIAVGISGAVQHRAGMAESAKILAINEDRRAPIFDVAHYGIVGNMNDVVPRLIAAIRAKQ